MKKFICLFTVIVTLAAISCTEKPAAAKKEVIIVPASPSVIVVKEESPKTTTIELDKNGVKVVTKKVGVVIKKQ
jgi:hypothetical protein